MPIAIFALTVASFCIGTTEFVIMGLLPDVAKDLGISIPSAGLLITGYALGVVFGGPIIAILTARVPRKTTLVALAGLFVIGNFCCAIAPNYGLLMVARIITALGHGAFFGIGSVVAADLVPRNQRARAMAMLFAGLTLANILGVPAGTALGQFAGWRATFAAVVLIGIASVAAIIAWVPRSSGSEATASLLSEFRVLKRPQVWFAMAISVGSSASMFAVFTYIAPILENVTGISPSGTTWILLVFGFGITLGNLIGGRLADWRIMPTIIGTAVLLILVLAQFSLSSHSLIATTASVFVWGILSFAMVPPLQMRVVESAEGGPNLASTLNQSSFNLGNASGAWIGGIAISMGLSYDLLPLVGACLAVVALIIALLSLRLDRNHAPAIAAAE